MKQLIAIALGGSLGAVARFLVANGLYSLLGRGFPHGTLFVNVSGSFLMGLLTELMLQRGMAIEYRAAILVGFLGAYTTFSTFSLETLYLFEEGSLLKAFLNIFLSAVLCLVAVWFGLVWGRVLFATDVYPWLGHGMPYGDVALGMLIAFVLGVVVEMVFQYVGLSPERRALVLVLVLGVLTMIVTLWLVYQLAELRDQTHGLLSIFAVAALLGVTVVWLGIWVGSWLWHLRLSR